MRTLTSLALVLVTACGGNDHQSPDAAPPDSGGNNPPPRIIPGGGIGDGPIDGVVNVYVIDDATRTPVTGAMVTVGTASGTTDATGLFVAQGLTGKQNASVIAANYRSEAWVGANGANMTFDLRPSVDPTPASGTFTGTIDLSSFTVAAGHAKVGLVGYSQDDKAADAENNLQTPNQGNLCIVASATGSQTCTYTVVTRPGALALFAAIVDVDQQNNITLIGWAAKTDLTAVAGATQTGTVLDIIPANNLTNESVDFGTPPSGLPSIAGVVGIDLGAQGTMQFPTLVSPTTTTVLVPKLSVFASATYRFTGIAKQADTGTVPQSVVLVRDQTAGTMSAGTWLTPPGGVTATHQMASWTHADGAFAEAVEYLQGTTHLINITAFDGSTTVDIPTAQTLPPSGMTVNVQALGGTLDVTNFSIDADRDKLTAAAQTPGDVN